MSEFEQLIDRLYQLHAEADAQRRREGLERTVSDDVEFYGIQAQAFGLAEFADLFHTPLEEGRLVRTTAVEEHAGWLRNGWQMQLSTGGPATSPEGRVYGGVQISQLSADGLLRRLVPFLGNSPPDDPP